MKQFGTILKFELKGYFKNKIFVGLTIGLMVLIAVVMFFPRIMIAFEGEEPKKEETSIITEEGEERGTAEIDGMLLLSMDGVKNPEGIQETFETAFPEYEVCVTEGGIDEIKDKVTSGMAECAFVLDSETSYQYFVNNLSMHDSNTAVADEALLNFYHLNAMLSSSMTPEEANAVMNMQITHEVTSLGKDQMQNFLYTYIMIFALYMVILLYGQMVATNVATEKSSRAMELLITSAKPTSMMFGKVLASCLAGLLQLVAVFGSAILFYNMNQSYWEGNIMIASVFDMPLHLLVYMLIFFVLGFFIYAFMFGAIGSTASKVEDINTSSMPLTLLFIVGFMVVMFSMTNGNVDTTLMRVCSYVPFTSPMAMFTRIAMSTVPFYEILISIVVLIASVIGVGVISAKIYRVGVLLYGTTPKLRDIWKAIWKA